MTIYPAQIDTSQSLPSAIDNITPIQGSVFNRLRDTILVLESVLGIQPNGVYGTVANRLTTLEGIAGNFQILLHGDLGGTVDNPLVIGIQGHPVSNKAPVNGDTLAWNGVSWIPVNYLANNVFNASGDLAGSGLAGQTVIGLQNHPISSVSPTTGQVLGWNGSDWAPSNVGSTFPTGPAGGDLSGSYPNPLVATSSGHTIVTYASSLGGDLSSNLPFPLVVGIHGIPISGTAPTTNEVLQYNGTMWAPAIISAAPSGPASGNLGGTYPNPTVTGIQGNTFSSGNPTKGEFVVATSTTNYGPVSLSGDVSNSAVTPGQLTVTGLQGAAVSSGAPNFEKFLIYNGTQWEPIGLFGDITLAGIGGASPNLSIYVAVTALNGSTLSNATPSINQFLGYNGAEWVPTTFTAGGDVSGSYANFTVTKIQNNAIKSGTLGATQDGYFLAWHNGASQWQPTLAPSGSFSAGGDLTGNSSAQTVSAIQTYPVNMTSFGTPVTGDALQWSSAHNAWFPSNSFPPTGSAGGDLSGNYPNPTVAKINGLTVSPLSPAVGQAIVYVGSSTVEYTALNLSNWGSGTSAFVNQLPNSAQQVQTMGGDVSGNTGAATVVALQGNAMSATTPTTNQVLEWNGTAWTPTTPVSGAFTAGGDLSGTTTDQTVIAIQGHAVSSSSVIVSQFMGGISSNTWGPISITGDISSSFATAGKLTVSKLQGTTLSATVPTSGQTLTYNGTSWAPATPATAFSAGGDLTGTATSQTVHSIQGVVISGTPSSGQIITATSPTAASWQTPATGSFTAGGDLSGTTTNQTVIAIHGTSVPATPSANQVLVATSGTAATWEQISDAEIATNAAISVIKLAPGTASQILLTNGALAPIWTTVGGDATISSSGVITNVGLQNITVPTPSGTNTVLTYNSGAYTWSAFSNGITQLTGDVTAGPGSGSQAAIVVALQGNPVQSGALGLIDDGYVLTWKNSASQWEAYPVPSSFTPSGTGIPHIVSGIEQPTATLIVNADVDPAAAIVYSKLNLTGNIVNSDISNSAAIAGSKVNPAFGGQNVSTTGTLSGGATTVTSLQDTSLSMGIVHSDSSGNFTSSAVNLASGDVTGILPTGNQASQTMGGDVTGTTAASTVVALQGNLVEALVLGPAQDGYVLTWNNTGDEWKPEPIPSSFVPSGTGLVHIISGIEQSTATLIVNADVDPAAAIAYSKLNLTGDIINSDISSSAAITVSKLAAGTAGQILQNNGTPTPTWTTVSGDVSITNIGATTVTALQNIAVSATTPTTNQVLEYNGSSWTPTTLATSYPPNGPADGDLSGEYPGPIVIGINGVVISGTPATGQVIRATSPTAASWQSASGAGAVVFEATLASSPENITSTRVFHQSPTTNPSTFQGIVNLSSDTSGTSYGALANFVTITGGDQNHIQGNYGTIAGGFNNGVGDTGDGSWGFVGGGSGNGVSGLYSAIAGGANNHIYAAATCSFLGGGQNNTIYNSSDHTVIGGGFGNTIDNGSSYSTIAGGQSNYTSGYNIFIGGGSTNSVNDSYGFIGGGDANTIDSNSEYAIIIGGSNNLADGQYGTVIGGYYNQVAGAATFVGAGNSNTAGANYSSIVGGTANTIEADYGFIGGGQSNIISDTQSFIGGGQGNTVGTYQAAIVGGLSNTMGYSSPSSFIGAGVTNAIGNYSGQCFIGSGNTNIVGYSVGYSSIVGGINNTIGDYSGESFIGGGNTNSIGIIGGTGAGLNTIGGGATNTINDTFQWGMIGGGQSNTVQANYGTVVGGSTNNVGTDYSFIGAGQNNTISSDPGDSSSENCSIVGGYNNSIAPNSSGAVIGGGYSNVIAYSSGYTTIAGGQSNTINYGWGTIGGGQGNTINNGWATVVGGQYNTAGGNSSTAGGSGCEANGDNSIAMGFNCGTGGDQSVAIGWSCLASGTGSFSCGISSYAFAEGLFIHSGNGNLGAQSGFTTYFAQDVNAAGAVLTDNSGNSFILRNGYAYSITARLLTTRQDAVGVPSVVEYELLCHVTGNVLTIDNTGYPALTPSYTNDPAANGYTIAFTTDGVVTLIATLTGALGQTVNGALRYTIVEQLGTGT